jgi:hypothetical protein
MGKTIPVLVWETAMINYDELRWGPYLSYDLAAEEIDGQVCWVCKKHMPDGMWFAMVLAVHHRLPLLAYCEHPVERTAVLDAIAMGQEVLRKEQLAES